MYDRIEQDITALVEARDRDGGARRSTTIWHRRIVGRACYQTYWHRVASDPGRSRPRVAYIGVLSGWHHHMLHVDAAHAGRQGSAWWCTKKMTTRPEHPERSDSISGVPTGPVACVPRDAVLPWVWLRAYPTMRCCLIVVLPSRDSRHRASVTVTCLDQGCDVLLISVVHAFLKNGRFLFFSEKSSGMAHSQKKVAGNVSSHKMSSGITNLSNECSGNLTFSATLFWSDVTQNK
ncbi:hypothetical protein B0H11DRAFT_1909170 [Mycena galericulata]|nr:hypothetical protein B0H11DRAFT_1909170 [Mycena galericulata]